MALEVDKPEELAHFHSAIHGPDAVSGFRDLVAVVDLFRVPREAVAFATSQAVPFL